MVNLPKILLIDDDSLNNLMCKVLINNILAEVDVHTFTSPEKGLAYILSTYSESNGNIPIVLFLDINMPVMTGWEVLDALSKIEEKIKNQLKIFMLSSSVDQKDKNQAASNPLVSEFISKPLTKATLTQIFSKLESHS